MFPHCGRNRTSGSRARPTHAPGNRTTQRPRPRQGRPGRRQASPAPRLFPQFPQGPSGLVGGAQLFLPSLLPLSGARFTYGWRCRPRPPWLGCVCACHTSEIVFMCIFPGSVHSSHQFSKASALMQEGAALPGTGSTGSTESTGSSRQPGPLPCPGRVCRGNCAAPTEAAAWARSMS